ALIDVLAARSQALKTRHILSINLHRLGEHHFGAYPQAMFAVLLPVDNEFFQRLAVPGRADDGVLVSFVVPVATGLDRSFFAHSRTLLCRNPTRFLASSVPIRKVPPFLK